MKKPLFLTVRISFVETVESWVAGIGLAVLALGIAGTVFFFRQTEAVFYQGVVVDGFELGGLTKDQAKEKITQAQQAQLQQLATTPITISVDDIVVSSSSAELGIHQDLTTTLNKAFELGRAGFPLTRLATITQLYFKPKTFTSSYTLDSNKVASMTAALAAKVNFGGERPQAVLGSPGLISTLVIKAGSYGRAVDQVATNKQVVSQVQQLNELQPLSLSAMVATIGAELSETEMIAAKTRAEKFVGKQAHFKAEDMTLSLNDQALIGLLTFPTQTDQATNDVLANWASRINREPQEPVFEYNPDTLEVLAFTAPRNGLALNLEKTKQQLAQALVEIEQSASITDPAATQPTEFNYQLTIESTAPKKSLADTNDLGITERIGFGDSKYDHSIPSRIHNVAHTSSKITNHIVRPGEEFSFNKTLGDVSGLTGFKPAYVIRNGRTELGDGGGVCQVSTTLFRSVLNAGLEVTRRKQHSYRVSYYELNQKPGIDATVYSGEVDFRFKNDTDHHILIHTNADSENLYMTAELFGTSDGRQTEIVDHEVWDFRAPPAPVYTIDPSLPPGVVRQVDWAVSGVKTQFTNVIKDKDGNEIRRDTYYSNYVPWSAKYIRGA
jgi:vancomycin resistance protein YoaR